MLVPACDTTPTPSAVTVIFGRVVVACTSKVPLDVGVLGPQQTKYLLVKRHFRLHPRGTRRPTHEEPRLELTAVLDHWGTDHRVPTEILRQIKVEGRDFSGRLGCPCGYGGQVGQPTETIGVAGSPEIDGVAELGRRYSDCHFRRSHQFPSLWSPAGGTEVGPLVQAGGPLRVEPFMARVAL